MAAAAVLVTSAPRAPEVVLLGRRQLVDRLKQELPPKVGFRAPDQVEVAEGDSRELHWSIHFLRENR